MAIKFILSGIVALAFSILLAPLVISVCKKLKASQSILHYVDKHAQKEGTPTMGGFIFLFAMLVSIFFLISEQRFSSFFLILVTLSYALLGFLDDFLKVHFHHNEGLKPYQKIIGQFGLALIVALYIYFSGRTSLNFFGLNFDIGFFIIPLVILVLLATTNSVNLTDGLDGLAGGVSFVYLLIFGIILTLAGNAEMNNLALVTFSLCGGLLGFLVVNSYPAKIFMGDTGSLALGGFIGTLAVLTGLELILPIMGVMFVLSALSDIIQVLHYKRTKKRVFLMAPLHHHFEQKGVHENRIVVVYIVITTVMCLSVLGGYLAVGF